LLAGALEALLAQQDAPPHEIVVVDNASTDGTAALVRQITERHPHLRYLHEGRVGLSYARNTGIQASTGAAVAFTDDDVRVTPGWLRDVARSLQRYPEAACVGGPVLPEWHGPVPGWLSEDQWSALGTQNHGPHPFRVDPDRAVCLIGANLVIRREALDAVGPFDPAVQRVGDGIGSTEDHEYHTRIWTSGRHGMYDPALPVYTVVAPERLDKRYHRRWHFGHGRHIARMRLPDMERATHRILGVPALVVKQAVRDAVEVAGDFLRGNQARAFERELRLWFAAGFIRERLG
jgi:GT2 family glycosyltransferase